MKYTVRHLPTLLFSSAFACGGVASTGSSGAGDGDGDRPRRPSGPNDEGPVGIAGDGDDGSVIDGDGDVIGEALCRPGLVSSCPPPAGCAVASQQCAPSGSSWGPCLCDAPAASGGSSGVNGYEADFVSGGRGTVGVWDGYLFTVAEADSTISPGEILDSNLCVSGTLGPAYEEWAMLGWNIAQEIDPETFEGGAVNAVSPGGVGVEVRTINNGGSGLRVVIQTDESGSESWCAPVPPAGGVIPWSDFRKECWTIGGESYDGVTPISLVGVLTYAGSDTLPTNFDYCVLHLGPAM